MSSRGFPNKVSIRGQERGVCVCVWEGRSERTSERARERPGDSGGGENARRERPSRRGPEQARRQQAGDTNAHQCRPMQAKRKPRDRGARCRRPSLARWTADKIRKEVE